MPCCSHPDAASCEFCRMTRILHVCVGASQLLIINQSQNQANHLLTCPHAISTLQASTVRLVQTSAAAHTHRPASQCSKHHVGSLCTHTCLGWLSYLKPTLTHQLQSSVLSRSTWSRGCSCFWALYRVCVLCACMCACVSLWSGQGLESDSLDACLCSIKTRMGFGLRHHVIDNEVLIDATN